MKVALGSRGADSSGNSSEAPTLLDSVEGSFFGSSVDDFTVVVVVGVVVVVVVVEDVVVASLLRGLGALRNFSKRVGLGVSGLGVVGCSEVVVSGEASWTGFELVSSGSSSIIRTKLMNSGWTNGNAFSMI